ncbi:N-methyl-L-tryptophan oxidase [Microbacterium aoyamense]|uniref:N-methyl-L-tryptophan oxidase n=1 Tax=Microbacterium aoyamense TaxID=344166 RepID=A0ABN2PRF0_9MICO|nr:FAD-dependent oxidoreductase [Microbacterium aoyamense]
MSVDAEVVVIGGGVMGTATAWQLARRGVDVVLVERFGIGHRYGASHGTSRNFNLGYEDPTLLAWLHEAAADWRELERVTGAQLLTRTGIVNHGPGRDYASAAVDIAAGGFLTEMLDAAEAARRWPGLRFDGPALYTPEAGRLHADRAVLAFSSAAAKLGARVLAETRVVAGAVLDDRVNLVVRDAGGVEHTLTARRAVVTSGAWTTDVLAALGATFALPPLRVTQEQPATFAALAPAPEHWPGFNHAPSPDDPTTAWFPTAVYGMGVPGEGVKAGWHGVGPVVHPDRRTYLPEPALAESVRRYAREWLPGVDADRGVEISCTYTSTPDAAFALDRVGPVALGAGFSGHGFKFAPTIGRVLADLVTR